MPHAVRFGYKLSAEQFGPRALLDLTVAAEQAGFDTAAISDHLQPWRHTGGHAPFSLAWLGAAGQATSRMTSARRTSSFKRIWRSSSFEVAASLANFITT